MILEDSKNLVGQFFIFPSLNKVALITAHRNETTGKNTRQLYVYDLETLNVVMESKPLFLDNYMACTYVAGKESAGKLICAYPDSANTKLIRPGLIDVKNLTEIKLADISNDYEFRYNWPSSESIQSYSGFFTFDNSNQIIVKMTKVAENKEVSILLTESTFQELDETQSYDLYGDGNPMLFSLFKQDYTIKYLGFESDESTLCNGVDYSSKVYWSYIYLDFNLKRSKILCKNNTAYFMNNKNEFLKCTTLENCAVLPIGELGEPITMETNLFYSKENNSIYGTASFSRNFYFYLFEKVSLDEGKNLSIKTPQSEFGYQQNWTFAGGSSWLSGEIRMVGDTAVSGIDIFDNEANRFLRIPPLNLSLKGNILFRERRSFGGKRYFLGHAMGIDYKMLLVSSDLEITELNGQWLRQDDPLDENKSNRIILFTAENLSIKSYDLITKEATLVYKAPEGENVGSYAQMNKYIAFNSYANVNGVQLRYFTVYDTIDKKVVLKKTFDNTAGSMLRSDLMKGFFFYGGEIDGTNSSVATSKIYKFNAETGAVLEKPFGCSVAASDCALNVTTYNGAAYLVSSGGYILNSDLDPISTTELGYRFSSQPTEKQFDYFRKYDSVTKLSTLFSFDYKAKKVTEVTDSPSTGYINVEGGVLLHVYPSVPDSGMYDQLELIKASTNKISINNYRYSHYLNNQLLIITGPADSGKYYLYDLNSFFKTREWTTPEFLTVNFISEKALLWQYEENGRNLFFIEKL